MSETNSCFHFETNVVNNTKDPEILSAEINKEGKGSMVQTNKKFVITDFCQTAIRLGFDKNKHAKFSVAF